MATSNLSSVYKRHFGKFGEASTFNNVIEQIDSVLQGNTIQPEEIPSLTLIKTLLRRGESYTACRWILDQITSAESIANDPRDLVAGVLFPRSRLDTRASSQTTEVKKALDKIRIAFFEAEPIFVLKTLARSSADLKQTPSGVTVTCAKFAAWILGELCSTAEESMDFEDPELVSKAATAEYKQMSATTLESFKPDFASAVKLVKTLRSLCRVVQEPEDVLLLYDKKFYFIRNIAITPLDNFRTALLKPSKLQKASLVRKDDTWIEEIHRAAQRVDCWNEHVWMAAMDARRTEFIPLEHPGLGVPTTTTGPSRTVTTAEKWNRSTRNNLTDIFLLKDTACETCCSITSMSAYFADLMSLLKRSPSGVEDGKSVLDILSKRRPDLEYLDLTCANAQTKIPYISLLNEALESYIRYQTDKASKPKAQAASLPPSIIAYNTPEEAIVCDGDAGALPAYDTGNTDESVYTELISRQLYPFSVFPFKKSRDEALQILRGFDLSSLELTNTFRDRDLLLRGVPNSCRQKTSPLNEQLMAGLTEVLARQGAAEVLGMNQQDFAAITRETYFVGWFADLLQGLSKKAIKVQSVVEWSSAQLWGYLDSSTMLDASSELGLSYIKGQLMRRSELEFQDISDLVKTQNFNQDLVIVNKDGSAEFGNSVEDLRLLASASKPPFTLLTEDLCWRLQSFIRLKSKLGWPIKDLDAAIYCLRNLELQPAPAGKPVTTREAQDLFAITPFVIKSLAAIVKLGTLGGVEPTELLPLWGPIDCFGDKSLLYTRFLTPALQRLSSAFHRPKDGNQVYLQYGTTYHTLDEAEMAICAGLRWPLEHFSALRETAGLPDGTAWLTLDTLSILYRHALICQMLSIEPSDCSRFFKLFRASHDKGSSTTPFDNPEATLAALEKWRKLFEAGWTLESLCSVLDKSMQPSASAGIKNNGEGVRFIAALRQGYRDMRNSFPFLFVDAGAAPDNVVDCAAKSFDLVTAKVVSDFVLDTQKKTKRVTFESLDDLNRALISASTWPAILKLVPDFSNDTVMAEVQLSGVLSEADRQLISALSIDQERLKEAVGHVCEQATVPQNLILQRFSADATDAEAREALKILVPSLEASQPAAATGSEDVAPKSEDEAPTSNVETPQTQVEKDAEAEKVLMERRSAFVRLAAPTILKELLETLISNVVRALFPELEAALCHVLLSRIVQVPVPGAKEPKTEPAMIALQNLSKEDHLLGAEVLDAYFTPSATDVCTFSVSDSSQTLPTLCINGIELPRDEKNKNMWMSTALAGGRSYHLSGSIAPSRLYWATAKSMKSPFTSEVLLPAEELDQAEGILRAIRRVVRICQISKITAEELQSLSLTDSVLRPQNIVKLDFAAPTLSQLVMLQQYSDLRDSCEQARKAASAGNKSSSLVSLFEWVSQTIVADIPEAALRISVATGWNRQRVDEILRCKYEDSSAEDPTEGKAIMMSSLKRFDVILGLQSIMSVDARLHRAAASAGSLESMPPISTLTSLAQPQFTLKDDDDATDLNAARGLRCRLTSKQASTADAYLMTKRRDVLLAFLLQQDYIIQQGITDADGLLQYFLVDVQMGPQLQTSRIKQAISVVQLFAQRCLLGLEAEVAKTSIAREQWEWRQQYSLWEAHVKLFLYPENWLEPTLRDDKSQIFDEFEASLMTKDLSLATFTQAVKTYVYSLNDVSSLEIVAYLHEPTSSTNSIDRFHFFGCTRSSPRVFYHRTVSIQRSVGTEDGKKIVKVDSVVWRPWTKIDMDIPIMETEWDGGRLNVTGSHLIPVYSGGRIYLFMPQITSRTIKNTSEKAFKDNDKFDKLSTTSANAMQPMRAWEVTMGWTELVGRTWTPKRVAAQSMVIKADPTQNEQLPHPNRFYFEPAYDTSEETSTIITIKVGYVDRDEETTYSSIGGFRFCEDQIRAVSDTVDIEFKLTQRPSILGDDHKTRTMLNNTFQQVRLDKGIAEFSLDRFAASYGGKAAEKNMLPLLWVPNALKSPDTGTGGKGGQETRKSTSITWTMSHREKGAPTGLVLSSQRKNGTSVSYFTLPQWNLKSIEAELKLEKRDGMFDMVTMDHTFAHELINAAARKTEPLKEVLDVISKHGKENASNVLGAIYQKSKVDGEDDPSKKKVVGTLKNYHELAQPAALYNWEVCVHTVMLAMDRFFATQQFNEALEVARLVFDPTGELASSTGTGTNKDQPEPSCWKFPPFKHVAQQIQEKKGRDAFKVSSLADDTDFNLSIMERRSHGALVHATARGRPEAYMKWIVMKYAETLTAAGDVHFQRGTLETLPLAIQRYIEASHILGPEPAKVPKLGKRKAPKNFYSLANEDEKLDLSLPFSRTLMKVPEKDVEAQSDAKPMDADKRREALTCYLRTTYFCVPLNPKFKELRSTVNQRLYNIRNSLDIRGNPVTYALIEPPIDPGALIALSRGGGSMMDTIAMLTGGGEQDSPLPRQRFEVLLHRSQELCQELRGLGERLLGCIEKKEGEMFSALRARHSTAVHKMTLDIKKAHLKEAQVTVESLLQNRATQEAQLGFYLDLIGEPRTKIPSLKSDWVDIDQDIDTPTKDDLRMSSYERMEMNMADAAGLLNLVAAGIDGLIAPLCAIPEVQANGAPMGVGASVTAGGRSVSMAVSAGSSYIKMLGMIASDEGGRAARKAQLTRQLQDRRLQANMRGREIKSIDKQIEIQQLRIQTALREIEMEESEIAEALQIEEWYQTKYTNAQLYSWMEKSLRTLYYQAYTLALSTARRAESALSFEHGRSLSVLRAGNSYFNNNHDGLLAADYLYFDLKRLETAYHETRPHDYEISKTISLRQIDPLALLTLRLTGSCDFSLSENLFDMDFPGHYMRRIRSVAVSIPAVIGPHSGINAILRLTSHRYRVSATSTPKDYASGEKARSSFRYDNVPLSAVAITSGSHDSGLFELSFSGPRYAPFEGAGAISSWNLSLPAQVTRFDYSSISDVLLHVQYTAVEGGAGLRAAAQASVLQNIQTVNNNGREQGFWALWDLKNDFVNEWYGFSSKIVSNLSGSSTTDVKMSLGIVKDRLPFWARQQSKVEVRSVSWVSKSEKLVEGMAMAEDVMLPPGDEGKDIVKGPLGKGWIKTWKNLKGADGKGVAVGDQTKWMVKMEGVEGVLEEGKVPTVYMLIHYFFPEKLV